ncbi:MAG: SoxR reducing system RseC family protein [Methylococcales bacterium]|nr:SoxR reducing system RseC family protein [Methylococcales bacterium]MDD5754251.1 SoxR reducing system RseC family protein [Methylococcales bacterium]
MIEEQAIVTRIEPNRVWIKSLQSSACGGCSQQMSCGTTTLAKLLPKREFAVDCDLDLQVGDLVRVQIDDSHLLLSSMLLYLLPLLVTLTSVGITNALLPTLESWLPEIALVTLLLTFWLIHHFHTPLLVRFCFKPLIVGRL